MIQMTPPPMAIYRFSAIPVKMPRTLFTGVEQTPCRFVWTHNRPIRPNAILSKKEGAGGIRLPDLRRSPTSNSHQNHLVLAQSQKWTSGEQDGSPEGNPCTCSPLLYDKGGKCIQWRKDSPFHKWCWENWTATVTECN